MEALARARRAGASTSVDPASEGPLREVGAARFLDWVRGVDLLLPNLGEARALSGIADPAQAASALARTAREVVVTCGARGAVWSDGAAVRSVQAAASGRPAVDVTGAGDAFAAGFMLARHGRDLVPDQALGAAAHLAAEAVAQVGAGPQTSPPRPRPGAAQRS